MYGEAATRNIYWTIILSILGHLFLFSTVSILPKSAAKRFEIKHSTPEMIEISKVSKEQLKKYKTVGIKGGSKDFSVPVNSKKAISLPGKRQRQNIPLKALNFNLDKKELNSLAKKINSKDIKKRKSTDGLAIAKYKKKQDKVKRERSVNKMIKREMLNTQVPHYDHALIKNTDINMHFTPPEGVDESELNNTEKKFYSFHKRSYEVYVNSFLKTFHSAIRKRPYVEKLFMTQADDLAGKLTFDSNGDLVSIKMIKWANNDEVQKVFEQTLKGIKSLKNPPEEFIKKDGEFSVYYTLKFSN